MPDKETMIETIVNIEWSMFSTVNNVGGKASCQRRPDTFHIMRASQFEAWTPQILESYYNDVLAAQENKRNICTDKYGYMMEFTVPDEYEQIKYALPVVSDKVLALIREIVDINLDWEEAADEKYPNMRGKGRPLRKEQDSVQFVSVETYLYCELKTYSENTIKLLHEYTLDCKEKGISLAEVILENTAKHYGYASLQQAEDTLAAKQA